MGFQIVEVGAAPKPVRGNTNLARQSEYDAYLKQVLESGKVGSIKPEGTDTTRSIAHRVTHAGKRAGVNLNVWTANGNVYFEKTDKARTVRKKKDATAATPAAKPAAK